MITKEMLVNNGFIFNEDAKCFIKNNIPCFLSNEGIITIKHKAIKIDSIDTIEKLLYTCKLVSMFLVHWTAYVNEKNRLDLVEHEIIQETLSFNLLKSQFDNKSKIHTQKIQKLNTSMTSGLDYLNDKERAYKQILSEISKLN